MTEVITVQLSDKEPRGLCYSHFGNKAAIGICISIYARHHFLLDFEAWYLDMLK